MNISKLKNKWFSKSEGEYAYRLPYWLGQIQHEDNDFIELVELKRDIGSGEMWCNFYIDFVDTFQNCGRANCEEYSPCNNRNGKCSFLINSLIETDRKIRLYSNRKIEEVE